MNKMNHQTFDPSDPKYRCCCGCCHVKTGTTIFCIVSLVIYLILLIYRILLYPHPAYLVIGVILIGLNILIIGSALFAVKTEQPKWIIPLLVIMIIPMILLSIQMIYSLYTYFAYNQVQMLPFDDRFLFDDEPSLKPKTNGKEQTFIYALPKIPKQDITEPSITITTLIIDFGISIFIQIWLFFVVFRCYQYLTAKKKAEKTPTFPSPNFYQYF